MAVIPLSQIPNAPDLSSMSAPQVNNVNLPNIELGGARAAVSRGYESAMQNTRDAGAIGSAFAQAGEGVYKAAKTLADKQQDLNDNAAWAEFSTNYAVQRGQFEESLDKSRPETWRGADNEFQTKVANPAWQALPVSVQQKFYPNFLKLTSEDQVRLGHSAFQARVAGDLVKQDTEIGFLVESGKYDDAKKSLERMRVGLSAEQYEEKLSKLNTAEQLGKLNQDIALRPDDWASYLSDLESKDEQIPGMPNVSKDQYPKLIERAKNVSNVQQEQNFNSISSAISNGELQSSVDVEKDPRFAKIKDEKHRQSLKSAIADSYLNTKQGDAFTKASMLAVKAYPQSDDPATEAMQIRQSVNNNVPSIYRDAVNKALDSKINEMATNGGKLKPETELIQYGTQRLAVARDGGVFGKFYSDKEVKDDSSGKKAKANIEAMKQMEDVELQLRNSGAKTRAEADKVIEEATAAGRAKQAAGEIGNQKGWLDFLKSRKKDEPVSPAGKITKYGYEKPGEKDYDSNSARGIGVEDNQLTPGESIALSPDLEKSTGAKIGDKVVVTLSNGEKMVKRFDDRTSKRLKGRVDIYSPDGNQPLDGVRVAKVEKYTEDGQG
ncbi:MAG: hypothetical protein AN484_16670 [Aphanizomenon flos-aquae WA102]|uniref:Uncharacterized protein n=1 Tax=Aphanizomenon flos-aquae WA102 TaxID=1710896 RepID=A0A1B7WZU8_APHFL|nr:MAG: hypothetical protein AN484_16670 [Aphanizomenon flos-aquae WA102]